MCQKKIMRKRSHESLVEEPPKKRITRGGNAVPKKIAPGEVLTDLTGKQWKVGKVIGNGGFGEIYLASDNLQGTVKNDAPYVVKIESHSNGPLFVEINCFLRIAKSELVNQWKDNHKINFLGMPNYVASGSHRIDNEKLRFLILPRYDQDLEKILMKNDNKFNLKTVIVICSQILDILEYIHSKGYAHCDIKASNIMHSIQKSSSEKNTQSKPVNNLQRLRFWRECNPHRMCKEKREEKKYSRNLRPTKTVNYNELDDENEIKENENSIVADVPYLESNKGDKNGKIYLLDYGLATKYRMSDGQHRQYCNDERKAHAGTILFCSLDAHLGAQSRRSDLESLGYNMIYWLTSKLPWEHHVENPETVQTEKKRYFQDLDKLLKYCFGEYPKFIYDYFKYVKNLTFEAKPDYAFCKKILLNALNDYGYKKDECLDFDNSEGWGKKQKKIKKKIEHISNKISSVGRQPLTSNTAIKKPILRGRKSKKMGTKKLNWSKILSDPEEILRQSNKVQKNPEVVNKPRDRKITDPCDNPLQSLDIRKLNPTYAMIEVFNKSRDRNGNYNPPAKNGKGDSYCENQEGNTPAMNCILSKMQKRKLSEIQNNEHCITNSRRNRTIKSNFKKSNTELKRSRTSPNLVKELKPKPKTRILRRYGLRG